jgi:hypothetical protein
VEAKEAEEDREEGWIVTTKTPTAPNAETLENTYGQWEETHIISALAAISFLNSMILAILFAGF